MQRDKQKILNLITVGQRLLAEEAKAREDKAMLRKLNEMRAWRELYLKARGKLPVEIAQYLQPPDGMRNGGQCSGYYHWQIKIQGMVPFRVDIGEGDDTNTYSVPLAEPFFDNSPRQTTEKDFEGDHALECALAFAVEQTIMLRKIEAERERMAKEYEEREALESREPKYEPVDVPASVFCEDDIRRMVQEELKKAGVLS